MSLLPPGSMGYLEEASSRRMCREERGSREAPRSPPATLWLVSPLAPPWRRWPEVRCRSREPQLACSVASIFILKADGEADRHEAAQLASFFLFFLLFRSSLKCKYLFKSNSLTEGN